MLDLAQVVREGEGLDVTALGAWLATHVPTLSGDITVTQFPKGHSNLTYLLTIGGHEVVLRRPPFGSRVKSAHDMGREHRLLTALRPAYNKGPKPIVYCDDTSVLGAPFYLMERIVGIIPRRTLPKGVTVDHAQLSRALVHELAALHAVDTHTPGLDELYKGEGFAQRQVSGWSDRWHKSKTQDVPAVDSVIAELARAVPADQGRVVVHNDFKYDNLVLDPADPTRIIGVLDWEMATVGCPLMDLGSALAYWVELADPQPIRMFAFGPTDAPGALTRAELVEVYGEAAGRSVTRPVFYFAFGLFKLAVVAQQIYQRFVEGHTKDARFASFGHAVAALGALARSALDRDRVSGLA